MTTLPPGPPPATIYALSSGRGRAGVAVLRISGPAADHALQSMIRQLPPPRRAVRAQLRRPEDGELLDDGLALRFPAPASYTGEDVVELHIHGGTATTRAVIAALATIDGLRLAEPGEFTRRAFDNGRMDLTAAEGLADLIAAETEAQRRQALRQAGGALQRLYDDWATRLTHLLAWREAEIDFSDEPIGDPTPQIALQTAALITEISAHLNDGGRGERLRDGVRIAIIGPPNAGKSSLINALARREAAIVSEYAGTTRDILEIHMDLDGWPVILCDTAGLREAADPVEREGVRRARAAAAEADLRLLLLDATAPPAAPQPAAEIIALNKTDLCPGAPPQGPKDALAISVRDGVGLTPLLNRLTTLAAEKFGQTEGVAITRARHREALSDALQHLERGATAPEAALAAEDYRLALRALGRLTGKVDVEDLLDVIFRDFCIGK